MFLLVLDKNPFKASELIPQRYKHKQLLELMQMISCVVDFGYEKLSQGKDIKEWIKRNQRWVYYFGMHTFRSLYNNLSEETRIKYDCILHLLWLYACDNTEDGFLPSDITTAIFRYKLGYKCEYVSNSELPIEVAVNEYKRYVEWKEKQYEIRKRDTTRN